MREHSSHLVSCAVYERITSFSSDRNNLSPRLKLQLNSPLAPFLSSAHRVQPTLKHDQEALVVKSQGLSHSVICRLSNPSTLHHEPSLSIQARQGARLDTLNANQETYIQVGRCRPLPARRGLIPRPASTPRPATLTRARAPVVGKGWERAGKKAPVRRVHAAQAHLHAGYARPGGWTTAVAILSNAPTTNNDIPQNSELLVR